MKYVLIIHQVKDYSIWKAIFDQAADIRKQAGEISFQLLKYDNNEDKIVHFSAWNTLDNARQFFESPQLIQIRKDAGVESPEFIYLEEIEKGIL